jgi:hypothetical protein
MRSSSRYVAFLAGLAILRALALIPIVGGLLWLVWAGPARLRVGPDETLVRSDEKRWAST